jgi:hypothetical protein
MQRRTLLTLGVVSAATLAVAGGTLALIQPARRNAAFTEPAQVMLRAVARAVLGSLLPAETAAEAAALTAQLGRLQTTIAGMPAAMQSEVDELLTIVSSAPGRRALVGLSDSWDNASTPAVAAALQDMRLSSLALRQQAFHALRDLTNAAYFADPGAWTAIGYPGPRDLGKVAPT